jgi:putative tricarboxylic transport membrane protein
VRPAILAPITALVTMLGAYTINNSVFDVLLVVIFGAVGYLMKKFGFEPGPLVLAFVLGSLLEESVRRSLLLFGGDATGFVTRPISGVLLALFVVVAVWPIIQATRRRRAAAQTPTDREGASV